MGKENSSINGILHKVRDTLLNNIPEIKDITLDLLKSLLVDNPTQLKNLQHFTPSLLTLSKPFSFSLLKPTNVSVIGSYLLGTMVGKRSNINLGIMFPPEMWSKGDEKYGKYLLKRALLLQLSMQALKVSFPSAEICFILWRGHHLMQRILLKIDDSVDVEISCILSSIPPYNISFNASPIISNLILSDQLPVHHMKLINEMITKVPLTKGALRLTNTFLMEANISKDVINNFQLSMIALYLFKRGFILVEMNEIQIFRTILSKIIQMKSGRDGNAGSGDKSLNNCFMISPLQKEDLHPTTYPIISLIEEIMGMNILFDATMESWSMIQCQSSEALRLLSIPSLYKEIFMKRNTSCWDLIISFDDAINYWPPLIGNEIHYQSEGPYPHIARNRLIARRLRYGLGCSIENLFIEGNSSLRIGVIFSKEQPLKYVVSKAQSADGSNEEDIRKFRGFWRDRAVLKRFPDSTVRYSVEWKGIHDTILWVMKTYFPTSKGSLHSSIPLEGYLLQEWSRKTILAKAFDNLIKNLRSLTGLPMMIAVVSPLSSPLKGLDGRFIDVGEDDILFRDDKQSPRVHDCIIRLEGSSKYPTNWVGYRLIKRAFLDEMSIKLKNELGITSSISSSFESSDGDSILDWIEIEQDKLFFRCYLHCITATGTDEDLSFDKMLLGGEEQHVLHVENIFEKLPKHYKLVDLWSSEEAYWKDACKFMKNWLSLNMALPFNSDDSIRAWDVYIEKETWKAMKKTGSPNSSFVTFTKFLWLTSLGLLFPGLESLALKTLLMVGREEEKIFEEIIIDSRFEIYLKLGLAHHKGGRSDLPGFTPQTSLLKDLVKHFPLLTFYPQFLLIDTICNDGILVGVKGKVDSKIRDELSKFAPELFTLVD